MLPEAIILSYSHERILLFKWNKRYMPIHTE